MGNKLGNPTDRFPRKWRLKYLIFCMKKFKLLIVVGGGGYEPPRVIYQMKDLWTHLLTIHINRKISAPILGRN